MVREERGHGEFGSQANYAKRLTRVTSYEKGEVMLVPTAKMIDAFVCAIRVGSASTF
jgi:hypothetical protein